MRLVIGPMAALAYGVLAIGYYYTRGYAAFCRYAAFWANGLMGCAGAPNARPCGIR